MCETNVVETFFVPLVISTLSFFAWHLFARQVIEFYSLKKVVHQKLIENRNLWSIGQGSEHEIKRYHDAIDAIRSLSARLLALAHSLNWISKLFLFRYNIKEAGGQLWVYQNNFDNEVGARTEATLKIERALRLPITNSEERVESVKASKLRQYYRKLV